MLKVFFAAMLTLVSYSAYAGDLRCYLRSNGKSKELLFKFDPKVDEVTFDEVFESVRFKGTVRSANFPDSDAILGNLVVEKDSTGWSKTTFFGSPNSDFSGSVVVVESGQVSSAMCSLN